jgi:GT2 family glycosyltransferase
VNRVGVVVIGCNEGPRLRAALESAQRYAPAAVYVDSASEDGSAVLGRSLGLPVVDLDPSARLTAARARNAGAAFLCARHGELEFLQFVDGDCELVDGWIERAVTEMERRPEVAVVCGRRRERHPNANLFHQLAEIEWETPIGDAPWCGGDALVRVAPFFAVGGYRPCLIAGEEPDLCLRLRERGWKIARIDADMTVHDIAMTRAGQWWRRAVRAGYGYAEGATLHRPSRHWVRETRSNWFWGLGLPALALGSAAFWGAWSLLVFAAYPALLVRIRRRMQRRGMDSRRALLYASACVAGKIPQVWGQILFHLSRTP